MDATVPTPGLFHWLPAFKDPPIDPAGPTGNPPLRSSQPTAPSPASPDTPDTPDADVLRQILGGDPDAFRILVARYSPRLFGMARRYSRNEADVQDIVQDILIKAYDRLPGYRGDAPFEHWLMRLAIRTCYDVLRARRRDREHTFTELSADEQAWIDHVADEPKEPARLAAEAARTLVQRLLERLSPSHRLVLTLLELEDRSVKEIAALTGWSVPLVKIRAFRARAEMRRCLEQFRREDYV